MTPVTLFRTDGGLGVLPSAGLDDDEIEALAEYDAFESGPAL